MSEVRLTRDADYLLCTLYDIYLIRRKDGLSRSDAQLFGGPLEVQEYAPELSTDEISDLAAELDGLDLIHALFAEGTLDCFVLNPSAIAYMENRFGKKIEVLLNYIAKLRAILFG